MYSVPSTPYYFSIQGAFLLGPNAYQYVGRFQVQVNDRWNVGMHKQKGLTHLYRYEDLAFVSNLQVPNQNCKCFYKYSYLTIKTHLI